MAQTEFVAYKINTWIYFYAEMQFSFQTLNVRYMYVSNNGKILKINV